MNHWTYFAGARASLEVGLELAQRFGIIWRGSRNTNGALISNVGQLRPGDTLHFTYRQGDRARYVFRAIIGEPENPAPGVPAIDRIGGPGAEALRVAGYPLLADGTAEVIRLNHLDEDVRPREVAAPPGQTAIREGQPAALVGG